MGAAEGILTSTGGMTSHAAVVARGWGKCCICGAGELKIDYEKGTVSVGDKTYNEGDLISLNGSTGNVYEGEIPTASSPVVAGLVEGNAEAKEHWIYKMYETVSAWADQYRKINVRTNADSPKDSVAAIAFGAEGIGLCRTEHMFFEGDPNHRRSQIHPCRIRRRAQRSDPEIAAASTKRLRRYLHSDEWQACHRSIAGSAVARIPSAYVRRQGKNGRRNRRASGKNRRTREGTS